MAESLDDTEFRNVKVVGKVVGELMKAVLKMTKLQANKNVEPIIDGLTKHIDEIVKTKQGRNLLRSTKHLVSKITNKEAFMTFLWKIFNIARRIIRDRRGKFGLFLMGSAFVIFFLLTVTGIGEGVLAVWLAFAARNFAGRLFSTGSALIHKNVKETVPNKESLVTLLNTLVSSVPVPSRVREAVRELEARCFSASEEFYKDWVVI